MRADDGRAGARDGPGPEISPGTSRWGSPGRRRPTHSSAPGSRRPRPSFRDAARSPSRRCRRESPTFACGRPRRPTRPCSPSIATSMGRRGGKDRTLPAGHRRRVPGGAPDSGALPGPVRRADRGIDVMLTPTEPMVAPRVGIGDLALRDRLTMFTYPFNAIGAPALAVPAAWPRMICPRPCRLPGAPGGRAGAWGRCDARAGASYCRRSDRRIKQRGSMSDTETTSTR